jgi:hypothetical protein
MGSLIGPLLVLIPPPTAPGATASLRLPDTGLDIRLAWSQVETDLSAWLIPQGATGPDLRRLQVQSVMTFGGSLKSDVDLRIEGHRFKSGSFPLAFVVEQGGALRFFLVDGTEAIDLSSRSIEPGWLAPHLLMQLAYIESGEVKLLWHIGEKAGAITFNLGLGPN